MSKSTLAKTDKGEIQLTITVAREEVKKAYDKALGEIAENTELPGFRKGRAPKTLVEQKAGKEKIYERTLRGLLPLVYSQAIKEHELSPVIPPKIELLKAQEQEDWQLRATTCERPKIQLQDYKENVRKALAPSKLWTPDKKTNQKEEGLSAEEKTQKAIEALLETTKVSLPEILVEEEVNRALASLINQTNNLGLTIDQYLASINKSGDQLRDEYRQKVEQDLKLQLILEEIVNKEKIKVDEKEVDDLIKAAGDEKTINNLNTPTQRAYIKGVLSRRKALDFLVKL